MHTQPLLLTAQLKNAPLISTVPLVDADRSYVSGSGPHTAEDEIRTPQGSTPMVNSVQPGGLSLRGFSRFSVAPLHGADCQPALASYRAAEKLQPQGLRSGR